MGSQSPLIPIFEMESDRLNGKVAFYIVDSGFIHPEFDPDEMPLTVFYVGGNKVQTAKLNDNEIRDLIERAG